MVLKQLGTDAQVLSDFQIQAQPGCIPGRVAKAIRDEYQVYTEQGDYHAEPSGALLYGAISKAELPAVGDWVVLRVIDRGEAMVEAVLPRRTRFSRRAAGNREDEQVLAANVDTALIVCGLDGDFNVRRMERYLTLVHESGAAAVIVLSKADLCMEVGARVEETRAVARRTPVIPVSSLSDEGVAPLLRYVVAGKTLVLLGSSGAGKSTLLNRLCGEERLATAAVRESDSRGRHTTTHRELVLLPGGAILIDNPGMRELQLWANPDSLDQTFDEIAELAQRCRFRDCAHGSEAGCAVQEALASGYLGTDRWESYRKLQGEIRRHQRMTDGLAAMADKQRMRAIHRAQRDIYKRRNK